jgi:hypothetical protein
MDDLALALLLSQPSTRQVGGAVICKCRRTVHTWRSLGKRLEKINCSNVVR